MERPSSSPACRAEVSQTAAHREVIVDFVCFEKKLIIEVDGGHHADQLAYDAKRSAWLEKERFRILRFWDNQVLKEVESVKEVIVSALMR